MDIGTYTSQAIEIFKQDVAAQSVGVMAYIITMYSFAFCKEEKFLKFAGIFSGIWSLHFFLLGAPVAAIVSLIDVGKNFYAIKHKKNTQTLLIFAMLYGFFGYIFYVDSYSLIPLCSSVIGLYLAFYVRGVFLNLGFLVILFFWLFYNINNQSIAGVASDITLIIAGIYGIFTMFILKKGKNTES